MADLTEPGAIYADVATKLAAGVDGDWREIVLKISVLDNSVGLAGEYATQAGEKRDLDVRRLDYPVSKALRNLHRLMCGGASAWSQAEFRLMPNGDFRFVVL
jgi:hypothetical protein